MSALSLRVRKSRATVGLSQSELAARVGVKRSAVTQWEHPAGTKPSVDHMIHIALETGVAFEWLATGRGNRWLSGDTPGHETPAMMLNFYAQCGLEERLLVAFRSLPNPEQQPLVDFVEAITARA